MRGANRWRTEASRQLLLDAADEGERLPSLRIVFLSGDWIPLSMPDRIRALAPGAAIVSLGGATEATWQVTKDATEVVIPRRGIIIAQEH